MAKRIPFLPRLIRLKHAPAYLGMDKQIFNRNVRPLLKEIKVSTQGVAFDRLALDEWVDKQLELERCVEDNGHRSNDLISEQRR